MSPLDKNYLSLQFSNRILRQNGTEFQAFFESVMEYAFPDFQKIRPYGNKGDRGNDGYRPVEGIFYQAYAPTNPTEKEANAAKKFKDDFEKLKQHWDKISTIKELDFVYNDKESGLTIKIEQTRAELKAANPQIEFRVFTPRRLEEVFFRLTSDQMKALGFDIDSRNALRNIKDQLLGLDSELDKESGAFVLRSLELIKKIIEGQNDEGLLLEYDLLEARALQKSEDVKRAREKLIEVAKRHPNDPRAFLYLAEIFLNAEDFEKNLEFLEKAESIDPDHWLLRLQKLIRDIRLEHAPNPLVIDENSFPEDPRIRSNYYRIYSVLLDRAGDVRAESFVERAIRLNPDKFFNYDAKISRLESEAVAEKDPARTKELIDETFKVIESVEAHFNEGGGLSPRTQSLLNIRKLHLYLLSDDLIKLEEIFKETFDLVLECYFDQLTEKVIADLIRLVELPPADLEKLKNHIQQAEKKLADVLAKILILQFLHKKTLLTVGKEFFVRIGQTYANDLISAIESKDIGKIISLIQKDVRFAVDLFMASKGQAELRKKIIEALPNDGTIHKEKLELILYMEEGDMDKAFKIVQGMDLSQLSYVECLPILDIVKAKKAWDSAIIILDKLLVHEAERSSQLQIKLELFTANMHLDRLPEVIRLGNEILEAPAALKQLDAKNQEIITAQTTYAYLKRGSLGLKEFIEKFAHLLISFEGKISAEAEAYLKIGDAKSALRSVVEAMRLLTYPSPEQYGSLFMVLSQIGIMLPEYTMSSENAVGPDSFVKLRELERWFYLGDEAGLDATKLSEADARHKALLGKRLSDKVSFAPQYRSEDHEYTIESILPVEKYILWQSAHQVHKLSEEGRWNAMEIIEVPTKDGSIDTQYLIARMEAEANKHGDFFKLYCDENIPLAFLALSEGGLTSALGKIASEQKGFVKATAGGSEEIDQQKEVANRMLSGESFYVDGTSAIFLAETGLFRDIFKFVPGLKMPQSVISLLLDAAARFEYIPGQTGRMGYANGKLTFSSLDEENRARIKKNFDDSIKILESDPKRLTSISSANKADAFSEQKLHPALVDACVLAQKEGTSVLTDDFLYLKANELETKKPAPAYSSSLILMRSLYEQGKVTFEEYLDYFCYLSSYRVRLLPLSSEDLEKAVLGTDAVKVVRPERIRNFNFPLTLSEEYGVEPESALRVIGHFLLKILLDDSILPDMAEKIFAEIVATFPTKQNRKSFAKFLLFVVVQAINKNRTRVLAATRMQTKVDTIVNFIKSLGPDEIILPNTPPTQPIA